jgi:SAM-dependent methyltransferase
VTSEVRPAAIDAEELRCQISEKYEQVAIAPELGFHFHTGRPLALMLGYREDALDLLPEAALESFAGTGNPFSMGNLGPGESVVDVGCGAGTDSLIAARQVGPAGRVVSVDMTEAMLEKARSAAASAGLTNIDFRRGYAESLPVPDGWADVVISNGVINLCPDKLAVMQEIHRALKPGGRIQIGDIVVHKEVPEDAKTDIALWGD